MISIEEVKTPRQIRQFINFPLKLYKGNPYFVPPLYGDEKAMFKPDYHYRVTCDYVCYNAYRDGSRRPATRNATRNVCASPALTASTTRQWPMPSLTPWRNGRSHRAWIQSWDLWDSRILRERAF